MKHFLSILAFAFVFLSCTGDTERDPVSPSQTNVFNLLPVDTQFLIYFNPGELRKTSFWDNYLKKDFDGRYNNDWLGDFERQTGHGLSKGISEVYIATTWEGLNQFVVRLENPSEKVKDFFRNDSKFRKLSVNRTDVFQMRDKPDTYLFFNSDTLLIVVNEFGAVENVLAENERSLSSNEKFLNIINKITHKNHYWMATDKGSYAALFLEQIAGGKSIPQIKDLIKSIDEITLAAKFGSGVEIESNWGCSDSRSAYLLSTALRSAVALDMFSDRSRELSKVIEKTRIKRNDEVVSVSLELGKDDIEILQNLSKNKNMGIKL